MLQKYQFMSFCSIFPRICCIKYTVQRRVRTRQGLLCPMTNDLKVQKRHDGGQLWYYYYLSNIFFSFKFVSFASFICQYTFATTYYQFQLSMQCTIKFGRSSYLVLHFPPLREFKDFPNTRQSKLSLCNGDVVQRHYRMKQCKLSFDLHKINSFQTFVDIIFLDILKLFYNSILNFDFKMGNVCQESSTG